MVHPFGICKLKASAKTYRYNKIKRFIQEYQSRNKFKGRTNHYNKKFHLEFSVFLDSFIRDESIIESFHY